MKSRCRLPANGPSPMSGFCPFAPGSRDAALK